MTGFLQFQLWTDCNHNCLFCTSRGITHKRNKVESCNYATDILKSSQTSYRTISLIGGEFFDGQIDDPEANKAFYSLIEEIAKGLDSGRFQRFLICTSFLYDNNKSFFDFIARMRSFGNNLISKVVVCTSWDKKYRFTQKKKDYWSRNLFYLKCCVPEVKLHVESVMTQHIVDAFLYEDFSAKDFERIHDCQLDFNTPFKCHYKYKDKQDMQKAVPGFFPKRKDFLKFLIENKSLERIDLTRLLNVKQHSTDIYFTKNNIDWVHLPQRHNRHHTCIHEFKCENKCCGYIDSDVKMHHDVEEIVCRIESS